MPRIAFAWFVVLLVASVSPAVVADAEAERRNDLSRSEMSAAKGAKRFQEEDLLGALRAYQRAAFWARMPGGGEVPWPASETPDWVEEIVPLAVSLDRLDDAVRYAVLLPQSATDDPPTLRRLALHARERGMWSESIRLQERWLASRQSAPGGIEALLTRLEIGRLQFLADDAPAASASFAVVQRALTGKALSSRVRDRLAKALGGSLATTWVVFGEAHLEAGQPQLAAEAFGRLAAISDATPEAAFWLARVALDEKRPLEAHELLRKRLEISASAATDDGLGAAPYVLLQEVYQQLNQPEAAIEELRRIADDQPRKLTAKLMLGVAMKDAGRADDAEQVLYEVVRRALAAGRVDPVQRQLTTGDLPKLDLTAIGVASAWLIERYAATSNVDDLLTLANELHGLLGELSDFKEELKQAFRSKPEFTEAVFAALDDQKTKLPRAALAELAVAAERYYVAATAFRETIQAETDAASRQALALLWWRSLLLDDQNAGAADALQWAIGQSVWPEEASEPYFHLAAALAMDDQYDAAFEAAQQAADREPSDPAIVERMGWTLMQADRTDEAIESFTYLVGLFKGSTEPTTRSILRDARLSLSYLTDKRGDAEAAGEWALQALDEFPDDAHALNDLAYLWTKQGAHLNRAASMATRAVALEPDNAAYLDSLGWARFRLGETQAALEAIERALLLQADAGEPADGEILDHFGDIHSALGSVGEAQAAWRRAAEAFDRAGNAKAAAAVRQKLSQAE